MEYSLSGRQLNKRMDRWKRAICREMRREQVYDVNVWQAAGAVHAQMHSELSICAQTPPSPSLSLPSPASGSSVVLREATGKCRTSSAELSLHSCWCQLLCPPSLLSLPRLLRSSFEKLAAATGWLLWEILNLSLSPPRPCVGSDTGHECVFFSISCSDTLLTGF